jgi:tetratricopeptide (TPR) repeat protein
LFRFGQYYEAALAFDRAGKAREAALAKAFYLKKVADELPVTAQKRRLEAYKEAAASLIDSGQGSVKRLERIACLTSAGDCYVAIKDHKRAAETYEKAEKWTKAALHFFDARLLDEAVRIVRNHNASVDQDVSNRILSTAKISYLEDLKLE